MMSPEQKVSLLKQAAEALFGLFWQSPLTGALNLSSSRRVRQWVALEREIPDSVILELRDMLATQHTQTQAAIVAFDTLIPPGTAQQKAP